MVILLPPPPNFLQINGYLRCRLTKNSPRRTSSTPAGVFCTLLASTPSICKKDYYKEQTVNLPRLFAKRPIAFGKQHNFFTTNQLSHKTRKKIFRMFFYIGTSFRIGTIQSKSGEVQPAELQGKPVLSGCPSSPKTDEGLRGYFPLKNLFRRTVC